MVLSDTCDGCVLGSVDELQLTDSVLIFRASGSDDASK